MSEPRFTGITVPKWGMSMDRGTVTAWHAGEGDRIAAGDEVVDVESDKIANVVEAKGDGVLSRRLAEVGATVPVGGLLGVISPAGATDDEIERFISGFTVASADAADAAGPAICDTGSAGRTIRYAVHGDGEPAVLLVHGFGGDMDAWMFNQAALAAEQLSVYSLELPGHGGSSKDAGDGSLAALSDAVGAVIDAAGRDAVHLVGHSLGGAAVLGAALERPGRVATVTLIAPVGLGEEIDGGYISGFVAAGRRKDMKPVAQKLFADPSLVTRKVVENLLRSKRIDGVDAALGVIAAAHFEGDRQKTRLDGAAGLDMPVQVIWGRQDRIIPCRHADRLPAAQVHLIDGSGHMPMMESAPKVNSLIADFIRKHSGSP